MKNDLEMIATCGPTEAQMIEELLRNNGIECTLQGNVSANILPTENDLDEVRIWVHPENAPAAQELVDAFFTPVAKEDLVEGDSALGVDDPDEPGGFTVWLHAELQNVIPLLKEEGWLRTSADGVVIPELFLRPTTPFVPLLTI